MKKFTKIEWAHIKKYPIDIPMKFGKVLRIKPSPCFAKPTKFVAQMVLEKRAQVCIFFIQHMGDFVLSTKMMWAHIKFEKKNNEIYNWCQ